MTNQELKAELDRIIGMEYPLIASRFIDEEIMLRVAKEISYEVTEWRGKGFPYRNLYDDFMELIEIQYLTTSRYDIYHQIGESEVVGFLNNYYRWLLDEKKRLYKEHENNKYNLDENDRKDFEEFIKIKPTPCKEPLDIAGYLHMCRIAYDAAPKLVYPDFISDLYVVARAKFNSCGLGNRDMHEKMKVGDSTPEFMCYHSEEMGFGGPYVHFEWSDEGWTMTFIGKSEAVSEREANMDKHRFLAMRRAGYPVKYRTSGY